MAEGRLQIYQAAHKIIDLLVKHGADGENRRLTRQEVRVEVGLDEELFEDAYKYLRSSGYVMAPINEEEVWVTPQGSKFHRSERLHDFLDANQKWFENISRSLQQPIPLSSPSGNIINNYGYITNPQIQQGTTQSYQTSSFTSIPTDELRSLLAELLASLSDLDLRDDNRREAEVTIAAVETQLSSPIPDQGVIRKSLESVKRICEGAAGSVLGSSLARKIAQFIVYMDAA